LALDARHAARGFGIATMLTALATRLVARDDIELIWCGDPRLAPPGTAEVIDLRRWPYPLFDSAVGKAVVRGQRADVLHLTGNTGWGGSWQPVPFVLTIHDLIFLRTTIGNRGLRQVVGHRYARRNVRRAACRAAVVAVPSRHTAAAVTAELDGVKRLELIYQGVDQHGSHGRARATDPYVVAFSGRDPRKGVDLVLHALRAAGLPDWRLKVLAGAGLPDGFEDLAAADVASGRVEILDYVPRSELISTLQSARAVAYASRDEGFGLPVLDAMAAGVPVITGLAPVTREVAGDAALMIDPADPVPSMAAALRRLAREPVLAEGLAERGRARAAEFSWDRMAEQYVRLYRDVLEAR
jgi:glycosyltransferase involved in cell wall biosynthesis